MFFPQIKKNKINEVIIISYNPISEIAFFLKLPGKALEDNTKMELSLHLFILAWLHVGKNARGKNAIGKNARGKNARSKVVKIP